MRIGRSHQVAPENEGNSRVAAGDSKRRSAGADSLLQRGAILQVRRVAEIPAACRDPIVDACRRETGDAPGKPNAGLAGVNDSRASLRVERSSRERYNQESNEKSSHVMLQCCLAIRARRPVS